MTRPRLFPTQEIGSIARPRWQLSGQRGAALTTPAVNEFRQWNERLRFAPPESEEVARFLTGTAGAVGPAMVRDWAALFGLRYFESLGLDRVYDGEARRIEMYEAAVRQMHGFEFQGHVRSFDNKYYLKAAGTGPVGIERPYHLEEFDFVQAHARAEPKVPVTGPYTIADWSYNEHYLGRHAGWKGRPVRRAAQREFVIEVAMNALRPTLKALIDRGARVIQIDEPAAGTHPDEADLVAEGFNAATEGLDCEFTMHICFSEYRALFPALLEAKRCSQWTWEFANRDGPDHDGYAMLSMFREFGDPRKIGLGVLDVHRDAVETPEIVEARILRAVKVLGDPERLWINPDCGLRTRSLEIAAQKLTSMVEGARRARAHFERPAG
ncbi:MAG: uroporphyrinogen decarboxylase/cobalamine-independent methonine synthase family protein [Thermoplasmata archaeon]